MDPTALNYNSDASVDDGSCNYAPISNLKIHFTQTVGGNPLVLNQMIYTNQANDNFLNPFTTAIDIKGNNQGGSGLVGTTYTIPLTDTLNQILSSTYKDLIVMIRYNGQPSTPVSTITVGFS